MFESDKIASYSNGDIVDEALRNYMLKIYNYMAGGLAMTGLVAYWISQSPAILKLFFTPHGYSALGWLALFAPLILVFAFGWVANRGTIRQTQAMFWGFSALMAVSLAPIFLIYTGASIARVFLITAASFGGLSIYGYTTKKDLSPWGHFLVIGVIGLIIASIVNMFMNSAGLYYALSYLTVFIFAGLTAYDTQKLKSLYFSGAYNTDFTERLAISGALSLYLDFINMFMALLRLIGDRR